MEILSPWSIQNNWTVFNSTSAFLLLFPVSNSVCFCLWELQRYPNSETTVFFFLLRFPLSGLVKQGVGLGIRSILVVFDCKLMDVNCLGPTKALRSD